MVRGHCLMYSGMYFRHLKWRGIIFVMREGLGFEGYGAGYGSMVRNNDAALDTAWPELPWSVRRFSVTKCDFQVLNGFSRDRHWSRGVDRASIWGGGLAWECSRPRWP